MVAAAQICPAAPSTCRTAQRSSITIKYKPDSANSRVTWKWQRGEETLAADYLNPVAGTDYALCLYAGAAPALLGEMVAPHGSASWFNYGPSLVTGFRYRNLTGGGGIQKILLRAGDQGRARIILQARGDIPDLGLPIADPSLPLVVQMHKSSDGVCWESVFAAPQSHGGTIFKGKTR
jgi:hypothetical protein